MGAKPKGTEAPGGITPTPESRPVAHQGLYGCPPFPELPDHHALDPRRPAGMLLRPAAEWEARFHVSRPFSAPVGRRFADEQQYTLFWLLDGTNCGLNSSLGFGSADKCKHRHLRAQLPTLRPFVLGACKPFNSAV